MASNPISLSERQQQLAAQLEALEKRAEMAELKSRGGDGTSGGMEPRLAVLEAEMKHVKENLAKLGSVPTDLATLKERIAHLPGKGFVVTAAVSTVGALTGILVLLSKLGVLSAG